MNKKIDEIMRHERRVSDIGYAYTFQMLHSALFGNINS